MKTTYKYTVDDAVLHVFNGATKRQRLELLRSFDFLAQEPFALGDSLQRDHTGRQCQVKRFGRWSVSYWPEHLANEVHILSVEKLT